MLSADTAACCEPRLPEPGGARMIDLPHAPRLARRTRPATRRRLLSRALIAIGIGMVPWLVVLAATLPQTIRVSHWVVAWVGLERRGSPRPDDGRAPAIT